MFTRNMIMYMNMCRYVHACTHTYILQSFDITPKSLVAHTSCSCVNALFDDVDVTILHMCMDTEVYVIECDYIRQHKLIYIYMYMLTWPFLLLSPVYVRVNETAYTAAIY